MLVIDGELSRFYGWSKSDIDNLEYYQWKFYYDKMEQEIKERDK